MEQDGHEVLGKILIAGGVIGAITGAATIVGWIASQDLEGTAKLSFAVAGAALLMVAAPLWLARYVLGLASVVGMADDEESQGLALVLLALSWLLPVGVLTALAGLFLLLAPETLLLLLRTAGVLSLVIALCAAVLSVRSRRAHARAHPRLKRCPDCAENVKSEARRCRYCGYRFDDDKAKDKDEANDMDEEVRWA